MEKTCQSKITNQILRWKQPMISPLQTWKTGIKAVLVDLDNTLIAWNNPDGTPWNAPVVAWPSWWGDPGYRGVSIIVPNGSSVRLRNLILTMKLGRSSPLLLGLIRLSNVSTMRKMKWSWSGINWWRISGLLHRAGIRSILVKLFGWAWLHQDPDKPGAWTPSHEANGRKIWSDCIQKGILRMEELFCIGCGAPFRQKTKRLGYTPISSWKGLGNRRSSLPTLFPVSLPTMNHWCASDRWWFSKNSFTR